MSKSQKPKRIDPRADIPDEYKPAEWLIKSPHRPANSDSGISHRDVLYAAVGRVLSAWELLETLLAWDFQRLIGTNEIAALRAWGSIASSKARIGMIVAAADIKLTGGQLARHRRCMEDVNLISGGRNLVAHGLVYWQDAEGNWTSDDARSDKTTPPFAIGPAYYNTNKFRDGSFYLFSLPQVEAIGMEIYKMHARVSALASGEYHRFHRVSMK
jgi:hypothetical protein